MKGATVKNSTSILHLLTLLLVIGLFAVGRTVSSQTLIVQDDTTKTIDFSKTVSDFLQKMNSGKVARMEIIQIPTNRVYSINVSSSAIDSNYVFKLVIRDVKGAGIVDGFVAAIVRVGASPSGTPSDLRWGCICYTAENERAFTIYFDRTGRKGVVNGACVNFDSDELQKWAQAACEKAFEHKSH